MKQNKHTKACVSVLECYSGSCWLVRSHTVKSMLWLWPTGLPWTSWPSPSRPPALNPLYNCSEVQIKFRFNNMTLATLTSAFFCLPIALSSQTLYISVLSFLCRVLVSWPTWSSMFWEYLEETTGHWTVIHVPDAPGVFSFPAGGLETGDPADVRWATSEGEGKQSKSCLFTYWGF